jgi:hypothetical protein
MKGGFANSSCRPVDRHEQRTRAERERQIEATALELAATREALETVAALLLLAAFLMLQPYWLSPLIGAHRRLSALGLAAREQRRG